MKTKKYLSSRKIYANAICATSAKLAGWTTLAMGNAGFTNCDERMAAIAFRIYLITTTIFTTFACTIVTIHAA